MAQFDFDGLNRASSRLGEAALDPSRWTDMIDDISHATGTTGGALLQSDIRTPDVPMSASVKEIFQSYFDNNLHLSDVRAARGVPLLMRGATAISDQNLFSSEKEMLRNPLYAEINRFGFRYWAGIGFRAGDSLWALSLQRRIGEGPFDESELTLLSSLSSRLTETATLSKLVGRQVLLGMTCALQLVKRPAITIDRRGFVVDSNALAEGIFDNEFRLRNHRLVMRDDKARRALDTLIDRFRETHDDAALYAPSIFVRREARPSIIIRVMPIAGAARSPFLGARAVLVFTELGRKSDPEFSLLAQAFGMTPAESRISALVVTGKAVDEIAVLSNISRETARSHLKSIFRKTGARRQSELAVLLTNI